MPFRRIARHEPSLVHRPKIVARPRVRSGQPDGPVTSHSPQPEAKLDPNRTEDGDYIVGRYRTPEHTRWKPGQSGNPKGRPPKKPVNLDIDEIIVELMAKELRVNTATGSETSDHLRVLLRKIYESAIKGNLGAARMLVGLLNEALTKEKSGERMDDPLTEDEKNTLATMMAAFAPGDIGGRVD